MSCLALLKQLDQEKENSDFITFYLHVIAWQSVYLPDPSSTNRMWHKINLYAEQSSFDFRVFLLLDWLPKQKAKEPSLPNYFPINEGRWEKRVIHAFPKYNCVKSNVNNLVQVSNLGRWFHFEK